MSVFRRIKTIVDSNINSFLDKAEDPEKLNRLMIAEMEEAAVRAENEVKKLEGELEENGKRIEEAEKAISRWQKRAEMAIDKGQDDMAKEAIRARKASEDIYGILKAEEESLSARCKELSEEKEEMEKKNIPYENVQTMMSLSVSCVYDGGEMTFQNEGSLITAVEIGYLNLLPLEEYERLAGEEVSLAPGEILAYRENGKKENALSLNGTSYTVVKWLDKLPYEQAISVVGAGKNATFVVTDEDYEKIYQENVEINGAYASNLMMEYNLDVPGTREEKIALGQQVVEIADSLMKDGTVSENAWVNSSIRELGYSSFYTLFGGLFFLGLFLGILFLMGAAMIIYYKQISEGYEDKERFEIMQKVGMSHKEVKASIRRQILMVFFLPLLMAGLHIAMAFPMVKRLLLLFGMNNSNLFAGCTVVTIGVFAVVYGIIYALTAKSYYRIVERK